MYRSVSLFPFVIPNSSRCPNQNAICGKKKIVETFLLARPPKIQVSSWLCSHFQLSNCMLHLSIHTLSVEHVHTFSWACAHFQLSMCTLSVVHVHTFRWACAHFQLCMCKLSVEHVHAFSWACAHLRLSMCTLSVEKCAHFHLSVYIFQWNTCVLFSLLTNVGMFAYWHMA